MPSPIKGDHFSQWDFEYSFKFKKRDDNFTKLWEMKSSARESLKDWLSVSNISPSVSELCANACSELIENSIKYTPTNATAAVSIRVNNTEIRVETINTAASANKAELIEFIRDLNETDDVKQLFVEKLLQPVEGSSHLGLIKIVMETKGHLELVSEEDSDLVHVSLQMNAG